MQERQPVTHELNLNLMPQQYDFVYADAPYSAFIGGIGSGKTIAGAARTILYCLANPGALGIVTAPTYSMLKDATLRAIRSILNPFPPEWYSFYPSEMRIAIYKTGAEILLRSTDEPDHLRGPNLAFVYMDEAAQSSEDSWRILQGRLRQSGPYKHKAWLTTTPKGFNWVYTEFAARQRPDYFLMASSSRKNYHLPAGYVRRLEEAYSGAFALQEIDGQFILTGGRHYFDPDPLKAMLNDCIPPIETRLGGAVRIWERPIPGRKYVAGGDLAWGERGAYSVLTIMDFQTGVQVAELYGRLAPDELAREAVALCRAYNDAFVGIESNGEGVVVVNKMADAGYIRRMYHRDSLRSTPGDKSKIGWQTDGATRPIMLGDLATAVRNQSIRPRCADAIREMMSFARNDRGRPEASPGSYSDHVMSWAIAWQMRTHAHWSTGGKAVFLDRQW